MGWANKLSTNFRGLDTLSKTFIIFYKEHNFCNFLFALLHKHRLLIRVLLKRNQFAPIFKGSKFFPFQADPFSKGRQNNFESATSPESINFPLNVKPNYFPNVISDQGLHWLPLAETSIGSQMYFVLQYLIWVYTVCSDLCICVHVLNSSLAEHAMPCVSKQCRSRSVGFEEAN